MQLIQHSYGGSRPSRFYIDGRRVSHDTYDLALIKARIAGWQHCAFLTRYVSRDAGCAHTIHYSYLAPPA